MEKKSKISRRVFCVGVLSSGLCEAATPLIDLGRVSSPFILKNNNESIINFSSKPDVRGINEIYFDPEPDLNSDYKTNNYFQVNRHYHPLKSFRLRLENGNTGESYSHSINTSFFNNQIKYSQFDYFFRDWREDKKIKMDRGVINNFLQICEKLVGREKTLNVVVTSGYRTEKTNEYLRQNSSRVAKNSMHLLGRAIDFSVKNRSTADLETVAEKLTPGGLGIYSGFVHIDTGPHRRWRA